MAIEIMKKLTAITLKGEAETVIRKLMRVKCVSIEQTQMPALQALSEESVAVEESVTNQESVNASLAISSFETLTAQGNSPEMLEASGSALPTQKGEEKKDDAYTLSENNLSEETASNTRLLKRVEEALAFLQKKSNPPILSLAGKEAVDFATYGQSDYYAEALQLLTDTEKVRQEILEAENIEQAMIAKRHALMPFKTYLLPLGLHGTDKTTLFFGTLPNLVDLEKLKLALQSFGAILEVVSSDANLQYCAVLTLRSDIDAVLSVFSGFGFQKQEFAEKETAKEEILKAIEMRKTASKQKEDAETQAIALAEKVQDLGVLRDYLLTDADILAVKEQTLVSESTVVLTGWLPLRSMEKIEKLLSAMGCAYTFEDPKEDEKVPVLLNNPKPATPFEMVLGIYSLPKYKTFDPTFIMGIFYFIIFGMMFADVGYGLLLALGCFISIKKMKLSKGMKDYFALFSICGVSCMIFGVLFGGWFGDLPLSIYCTATGQNINDITREQMPAVIEFMNYGLLFNPVGGSGMLLDVGSLGGTMWFMVLSIALGIIHIMTGMGIQFYNYMKEGNWVAAVFDIGSWFFIFVGIGVCFLHMITGIVLICLGVLMMVAMRGREAKNPILRIFKGFSGLYDIVSYASDFLSYSRILALGLAATVIAQVINMLVGLMTIWWAAPFALIILFLGHVMNLAINLLGSFVHTARLQFVEFFGKFFVDGGEPFVPIAETKEYTEDVETIE